VQVNERVNLELEFVLGTPISGRLVGPATRVDFVGWAELVAGLRRAAQEHESASTDEED
jgi:hypothetical protein